MDKRITYRNGLLPLLYCAMNFALWRKERRVHTCCALVVTIALLMDGFFPQNHNRTIVCSTTTLCKALRVIIVFRSKSLASALFACLCPTQLTSWLKERRIHTWCVLVASSALSFVVSLVEIIIERSFVPQVPFERFSTVCRGERPVTHEVYMNL